MRRRRMKILGLFLIGMIYVIMVLPLLRIQDPVVLNGSFDDWKGHSLLAAGKSAYGLGGDSFASLQWTTNPNEYHLYFSVMLGEPVPIGEERKLRLYFDINDNQSYEDPPDRFAAISYLPGYRSGEVRVDLYTAEGRFLETYEGEWGAGYTDQSSGFEFHLPMSRLGIFPGQRIRFYLAQPGIDGKRFPTTGDIQWSPFPTVTRGRLEISLFILLWGLLVIALFNFRIWPLYFVIGAVGFTFIFILLIRGSAFEYQIEQWTGIILHNFMGYLGIPTHVFDKEPGTILVFIRLDESWTSIDINIESSAVFEIAVMLGLVIFYPAYGAVKKLFYAFCGTLGLLFFNLIRMAIIITVINRLGRNFNFIAHTLVGRIFFFLVVIILFWYILTRPAVRRVREEIESA